MNNQPSGFIALVTVLIISAVALSTASTVSLLAIGEAQTSLAMNKGEENLQLVEGCAEDALLKAWASNSYNGGNITRPEGTCIITVAKAGNNWTITATTTATSFNRTVQVAFNRTNGIVMNSWNETLTIPTPTPTSTLTPTPTPTPIPGRVGHWKFNEGSGMTAADSSGTGNNGTLTGTPTWSTGKLGQALDFDGHGSGDYVSVPNHSSINFGASQNFTISAWVKSTEASNSYPAIVHKLANPGGIRTSWDLVMDSVSSYKPMFEVWVSNVFYQVTGPTPINDGAWHHVVGMRQGSTIFLYQDGVFAGSLSASSASLAHTQPLRIGADDTGDSEMDGQIDDVRIYNRALSLSEITAIYNGAP